VKTRRPELEPLDCCLQILVKGALGQANSPTIDAYEFGSRALARRSVQAYIRNATWGGAKELAKAKRTIRAMIKVWLEYYRRPQ